MREEKQGLGISGDGDGKWCFPREQWSRTQRVISASWDLAPLGPWRPTEVGQCSTNSFLWCTWGWGEGKEVGSLHYGGDRKTQAKQNRISLEAQTGGRDLGSWRSRSCGWGGASPGPKGREVGGAPPGTKAQVPRCQASAGPTHLSSWRMADQQSAWRDCSEPSASAVHIRPPPESRTPGPKARQPSPPCRFPRLAPRARRGEEGDGRGPEDHSLRPSRAPQVGPRRSPAPVLEPQAGVGASAPCPPQTREPAPSPLLSGLGQPQGFPGQASSSGILPWTWTSSAGRDVGSRCSGPGTSPSSLAPGLTACPGYLDARSPATPRTPGPGGKILRPVCLVLPVGMRNPFARLLLERMENPLQLSGTPSWVSPRIPGAADRPCRHRAPPDARVPAPSLSSGGSGRSGANSSFLDGPLQEAASPPSKEGASRQEWKPVYPPSLPRRLESQVGIQKLFPWSR